jgi:polar amino acid transport system substrate-binding protein
MDTRRHFLVGGAAALASPWAPGQPASAPSGSVPSGPSPLVLANAVYPPLVNPRGHASGEGIDIDIAREALRRGGAEWPLEIQWVPWKRVLSMLERGLADFTTTVNFSPERERFLRFSSGYRQGTRYHFYSRKGAGLNVRKLEDLRGHRLALSEGFIYPEPVLQMVGKAVEYGKDVAAAVRLVEAGRAEVVIVSHLAGLWAIREQGLAGALERQPFELLKTSPVFMAFSRASPRAEAALAAMNAGLASMKRDGSIVRIEQRYLR